MLLTNPKNINASLVESDIPPLTDEQRVDPFILSESSLKIEITGLRLFREHFRFDSPSFIMSDRFTVVPTFRHLNSVNLFVRVARNSVFVEPQGELAISVSDLHSPEGFEAGAELDAYKRTSVLLAILQGCTYHSLRLHVHATGGKPFDAGGPLPLTVMPAGELETFASFVRKFLEDDLTIEKLVQLLAHFKTIQSKKSGRISSHIELLEVPRSLTSNREITSVILNSGTLCGLRYRDGRVQMSYPDELSPSGKIAFRIRSSLDEEVVQLLDARPGGLLAALSKCTLAELTELDRFIDRTREVKLAIWDRIYHNRKLLTSGQACASNAVTFGAKWWENAVDVVMNSALQQTIARHAPLISPSNSRLRVSAVDVEDFARTIPAHPLVERVFSQSKNTLVIVLRESLQPDTIQRQGRTYVEEVPGTVISNMVIRAFKLSLDDLVQGFPRISAFADSECTVAARHTNIMGGIVCQGDLMQTMSSAEVAERGFAFPSIGNLVQMLRQCNLDSAYHRDRDFVLKDPSIVSMSEWTSPRLEIPGLRCVTLHIPKEN